MKHLHVFGTESEFQSEQSSLSSPWVALTNDDSVVHYGVGDPESDFVDLGLPSGALWAKCNVGAEHPWEYGKYFAWGDTTGYYDTESRVFDWTTYKFGTRSPFSKYDVDGKMSLEYEDDPVQVVMGDGWCMPSKGDIDELIENTNTTWIDNYKGTGINGYLFTSLQNSNASLFIPASGSRMYTSINLQNTNGVIWSSSRSETDSTKAWRFIFSNSSAAVNEALRFVGACCRGVKHIG